MRTTHARSDMTIKTQLLKIGLEVFPVYGVEQLGWSVEAADLYPQIPPCFRYGSIGEIFFALVNLNLCPEGRA